MMSVAVQSTLVAGYAAALTLALLMPGSGGEPLFAHDDKLAHLLVYAVFALLCAPFWRRAPHPGVTAFWVLSLLWLHAATMEFAQSLVPGREASWLDMAANTLGLLAGLLLSLAIKKPAK